jgi:hypothetical protein
MGNIADSGMLQVLMTVFTAFLMLGVHYGAGQHQVNVPVDDLTLAMKVRHSCILHADEIGTDTP